MALDHKASSSCDRSTRRNAISAEREPIGWRTCSRSIPDLALGYDGAQHAEPRRWKESHRVKIAWFDPFSGASGDMILGALLDAGCPADALRAELARMPLTGYRLAVERASQHGIGGSHVEVVVEEGEVSRDWRAIRALL